MKQGIFIFGFFFCLSLLFASSSVDLNAPLPVDPDMIIGKLPNGLTYFIKVNHKPESRAELRLVVKTGSVQEDDDQQGLAHFVEHMAFNGTKHFQKKELTDYLNSIGMGFAAGLNGYTTFDNTVYMLKIPTDKATELKQGFLILSDWANGVSFDPDEIEKERGVVLEEIRGWLSANERINKIQNKVIFQGSKYADRDVLGQAEVIASAKPEVIKRFYNDWYRPDLQAVIAVGDFDPKAIENYIKEYFTDIPKPVAPRPLGFFPVPDSPRPVCVVTTDKEASEANIRLIWKHAPASVKTEADFKSMIAVNLYSQMFSSRLEELTLQPNPPFSYTYNYKSNAGRSKSKYLIYARVADTNIKEGMRSLLSEIEKAKRKGFTQEELTRAKKTTLREMDNQLLEKDKSESANLIWEIVYPFTDNGQAMGIEQAVEVCTRLLEEVDLTQIQQTTSMLMPDNVTIAVSAPEKEGLTVPSEAELLTLLSEIKSQGIKDYDDEVNNDPILPVMPAPGKIIKERSYTKTGIKVWTLSNGATIYARKTDSKNDEVQFKIYAPGGYASFSDKDIFAAKSAAEIAWESGIGSFSPTELQKNLAGKTVWIYPNLDRFEKGYTGSSSPKNLETAFQLIYQYAHAPRFNDSSFQSWKKKNHDNLINRGLNPEECFSDTVSSVSFNRNPRARNMRFEDIEAISLNRVQEIYKEMFQDFSSFSFFFVGNYDEEQLKSFCETYLGSTVNGKKTDVVTDDGMRYLPGIYDQEVYAGIAEKSIVQYVFHEEAEISSRTRAELIFLEALIREKLNENIRENRSGVYGISFWAEKYQFPTGSVVSNIYMECSPDRVDELSAAVLATLDSLKAGLIGTKYLNSVKQTRIKQMQTNLKNNEWWLNRIKDQVEFRLPLEDIMKETELTANLTIKDMQRITKKYLVHDVNMMRFDQYPANKEK